MKKKMLLGLFLFALLSVGAQPASAAGRLATEIQKTSTFDEFADAGAELVDQYEIMTVKSRRKMGDFDSGRLIVKANARFPAGSYGALKVVKSPDHIYLMQFADSGAAKKAMARIKQWPGVKYAEPDVYIQCDAVNTKGSVQAKSWGVRAMGADKYAKRVAKATSRQIKVAVVDTGVSKHPRLSGRLVSGRNFVTVLGIGKSDVTDRSGHGTHVAGTIVDCTPGLKVKIMPVKVMTKWGYGFSSMVCNGVDYAANHGAKVINLSLGGGHSQALDDRISRAVKKGVVVVVAAGNDNRNTSKECPAHLKKAIVVGAVNRSNKRANFSNYGSSLDVVAPGVKIVSTAPNGGYQTMSGTSMATPHIAAVAAMYKLRYPKKTPAQIESLIKKNTKDLGKRGRDNYYGYGIPKLK